MDLTISLPTLRRTLTALTDALQVERQARRRRGRGRHRREGGWRIPDNDDNNNDDNDNDDNDGGPDVLSQQGDSEDDHDIDDIDMEGGDGDVDGDGNSTGNNGSPDDRDNVDRQFATHFALEESAVTMAVAAMRSLVVLTEAAKKNGKRGNAGDAAGAAMAQIQLQQVLDLPWRQRHGLVRDLRDVLDGVMDSRRHDAHEFYALWREWIWHLLTSGHDDDGGRNEVDGKAAATAVVRRRRRLTPAQLFGWEMLEEAIHASARHRPPPRAYHVKGAGCSFVNGLYTYAGRLTSDGYALLPSGGIGADSGSGNGDPWSDEEDGTATGAAPGPSTIKYRRTAEVEVQLHFDDGGGGDDDDEEEEEEEVPVDGVADDDETGGQAAAQMDQETDVPGAGGSAVVPVAVDADAEAEADNGEGDDEVVRAPAAAVPRDDDEGVEEAPRVDDGHGVHDMVEAAEAAAADGHPDNNSGSRHTGNRRFREIVGRNRKTNGPLSHIDSTGLLHQVRTVTVTKTLTLFQCTMQSKQKWWFLSEADEEQPGTDRDVDYYHQNRSSSSSSSRRRRHRQARMMSSHRVHHRRQQQQQQRTRGDGSRNDGNGVGIPTVGSPPSGVHAHADDDGDGCHPLARHLPPTDGWRTAKDGVGPPPSHVTPVGAMVPPGQEGNTLEHQLARWMLQRDVLPMALRLAGQHAAIADHYLPLLLRFGAATMFELELERKGGERDAKIIPGSRRRAPATAAATNTGTQFILELAQWCLSDGGADVTDSGGGPAPTGWRGDNCKGSGGAAAAAGDDDDDDDARVDAIAAWLRTDVLAGGPTAEEARRYARVLVRLGLDSVEAVTTDLHPWDVETMEEITGTFKVFHRRRLSSKLRQCQRS